MICFKFTSVFTQPICGELKTTSRLGNFCEAAFSFKGIFRLEYKVADSANSFVVPANFFGKMKTSVHLFLGHCSMVKLDITWELHIGSKNISLGTVGD